MGYAYYIRKNGGADVDLDTSSLEPDMSFTNFGKVHSLINYTPTISDLDYEPVDKQEYLDAIICYVEGNTPIEDAYLFGRCVELRTLLVFCMDNNLDLIIQ